jgi:hypothetical protein
VCRCNCSILARHPETENRRSGSLDKRLRLALGEPNESDKGSNRSRERARPTEKSCRRSISPMPWKRIGGLKVIRNDAEDFARADFMITIQGSCGTFLAARSSTDKVCDFSPARRI